MMMTGLARFSLEGHRVFLTGGSGGIGIGVARCLLDAGAEVIISGASEAKLCRAYEILGGQVGTVAFDVKRTEDAEELVERVRADFGPVSALINNAGNMVKKPVSEMTDADFASVIETHVSGAFALTRAFLPQIKASRRGSILYTASMASFLGIPHVIGYSAAKSALVGMVRALATELAPDEIRVNGVAPGWIGTEMVEKNTSADPARLQKIIGRIPMGEFGTPEDIGWAMVFLLSPAAGYVTGHTLAVDGGALYGF